MVSRLLGHKGQMTLAVDREAYYAGDSVEVTVTLTTEHDLEVEEVYAELAGAARYRAGEDGISSFPRIPDYHRERKTLAPKSTIRAGLSHTYGVTFDIPGYMPPTYRGNVIDIEWLVTSACDVRLAPDITAELEIPVLAAVPESMPEPGDNADTATTDDCGLSLSLQKTAIAQGETFSALLVVQPSNDFFATDIRAEVILFEEIPVAVGYKRKSIEQKMPVAGKTRFESGVAQSFSFKVTIPAGCAPTIRTAEFKADWRLKAIVSRRMRPGYEIVKPFTVYSAANPS